MKKIVMILGLLSTAALANDSIIEKAANEWQVEVLQAAQRGTVGAYFLFRDMEIRSENSLLKTIAEQEVAAAQFAQAKENADRILDVFEKNALSKQELEMAQLWLFKTGKEVEKAKIKVLREKLLIEISRHNRQEAFSGEKIDTKIPPLYLAVWKSDCSTHALDEEIAKAEVDYAQRSVDRLKKLIASKAATTMQVLEGMTDLTKAQKTLAGVQSTVKHCRALELLAPAAN